MHGGGEQVRHELLYFSIWVVNEILGDKGINFMVWWYIWVLLPVTFLFWSSDHQVILQFPFFHHVHKMHNIHKMQNMLVVLEGFPYIFHHTLSS